MFQSYIQNFRLCLVQQLSREGPVDWNGGVNAAEEIQSALEQEKDIEDVKAVRDKAQTQLSVLSDDVTIEAQVLAKIAQVEREQILPSGYSLELKSVTTDNGESVQRVYLYGGEDKAQFSYFTVGKPENAEFLDQKTGLAAFTTWIQKRSLQWGPAPVPSSATPLALENASNNESENKKLQDRLEHLIAEGTYPNIEKEGDNIFLLNKKIRITVDSAGLHATSVATDNDFTYTGDISALLINNDISALLINNDILSTEDQETIDTELHAFINDTILSYNKFMGDLKTVDLSYTELQKALDLKIDLTEENVSIIEAGLGINMSAKLSQEAFQDAVEDFQEHYMFLGVDGILGKKTLAAMKIASAVEKERGGESEIPAIEGLKGEDLWNHPLFNKKISLICEYLGAQMSDMKTVLEAESRMDPRARGNKAYGLLQWKPGTLTDLGTTVDEIKNMDALRQLDLLLAYFERNRGGQRLETLNDLYLVTFHPASIGKPDAAIIGLLDGDPKISANNPSARAIYDQNPAIRKHVTSGNPYITIADFRTYHDSLRAT